VAVAVAVAVVLAVVEGGDLVREGVVSSALEEVVASSFVGSVCSGGGEEVEEEGVTVLGEW